MPQKRHTLDQIVAKLRKADGGGQNLETKNIYDRMAGAQTPPRRDSQFTIYNSLTACTSLA